MTDLRQGVTAAAHEALDMVEQLRTTHADLPPVQHLEFGKGRAQQASRTANPSNKRTFALQAAAHLILAVELNDSALAERAA